VRHLEIVKSSQELRLVFERIEPLMTKFYSSIYLSEDLWRAIKGYSETEEAAGLQGARKRFLDLTLLEFKRHGAELTPSQKQRLLEIDLDLAQCTTKFRQNILDATKAYELLIADEKQLAGLPPRALEAARQSAAEKGLKGLRLTLQIPSYIAALKFVNDAEIRQTLYRAYNTIGSRAPYDNSALVLKILNLRKEKAQLLGYRDFADLVCADRMVKDGPNAFKFVDNLVQRVRGYFKKEIEALQAFRIELEGPATPPLRPWDVAYYAEKLKQRRFNFNEEDLRPYFPLPQVLQGLFRAHRGFGRACGLASRCQELCTA
jgi:oligopeptidase A